MTAAGRSLRALGAALVLTAVTIGLPWALAATAGNPLAQWPALQAGDLSDTTLLAVLAGIAWLAWAYFSAALLLEAAALARALPSHRPLDVRSDGGRSAAAGPSLPGAGTLARTLLLALVLGLPGTIQLAGSPPSQSAPLALTALDVAPGATSASTHRAPAVQRSGHSPDNLIVTSALGLAAGVSLREIERLRRRRWRHRRPGRILAPLPPGLAHLEQALSQPGQAVISDRDRLSILAALADTHDRAMPSARGETAWEALSDAAGAPLPGLINTGLIDTAPPAAGPGTTERPSDVPAHPAGHSGADAHEAPAAAGVDWSKTASTPGDLARLGPRVPHRVQQVVLGADPTLDDDLAEWHAEHRPRPRLSLLGPPTVRAQGTLPSPRPRVAWHTEVLCYLAAHPRGVTSEKLGTDLWPEDPDITSKPKLRGAAFGVRRWLGTDPDTGREYLPQARAADGTAFYKCEGLLTDADLFRRLRLRGVSRGPHGIDDLEQALHLVTGPPLDPSHRRSGGYSWLYDTPIDVEYTAMITDVAHLTASYHLSAGRPDHAAHAATIALTATHGTDDIPVLDLITSYDAQGLHSEADAWVQHLLNAHDADVEEDLPPRTAEILHRRRWHAAS